ncbi:MAG: cytochrome C oxidase subunit IV family protein [Acidobacteriaceae bacterium]
MAAHVHHAPNPKTYLLVWLFLIIMTGVTAAVAYIDMPGPLNAIVALVIAVIKALAVALIFMHLWVSSRLTKLTAIAGMFFLGIMLTLVSIDYISRSWIAPSIFTYFRH